MRTVVKADASPQQSADERQHDGAASGRRSPSGHAARIRLPATSVLFDARLLRQSPTGIGQYIAALVPEILRAAPDVHLHLLRPPQVFEGYGVDGWNAPNLTQHIRDWAPMSIAQHWLIPRLARRLGVDLVHYPHFDAPVWLPSPPIVATVHDAKYLAHPELFPRLGNAKHAYMRLAFGMTLRRAAGVIAVSRATAVDLDRLFELPQERLKVIYEAADPSFAPAPAGEVEAFRQRYRLARPYLLSVGELRPHKNHAALVGAYARSNAPATHDLVIVGRRHGAADQLSEAIAETDNAERVHVLTDVDGAGLRAAYTGADLFVLVSLYEGFGLPLLEAMACGLPVIASDTTATGEIVGEAGLTVSPTDQEAISAAIDACLHDPALRSELQARGRTRLADFSWRKAAEETVAVYRQIAVHA